MLHVQPVLSLHEQTVQRPHQGVHPPGGDGVCDGLTRRRRCVCDPIHRQILGLQPSRDGLVGVDEGLDAGLAGHQRADRLGASTETD